MNAVQLEKGGYLIRALRATKVAIRSVSVTYANFLMKIKSVREVSDAGSGTGQPVSVAFWLYFDVGLGDV